MPSGAPGRRARGYGAPRGRAGRDPEKPACSQRPGVGGPARPGPLARRNGGLACGRRRCRSRGGTAPSGPRLGGVQQRLSDSLRAMLGADSEVLDPATKPVADRAELHACAAGRAASPRCLATSTVLRSASIASAIASRASPGSQPGGTDPGGAKSHSYAASRASTSTSSASATAISAMDAPYIRRGPAPRALCPSVRGPQRPPRRP